jgi:hypothetical protein
MVKGGGSCSGLRSSTKGNGGNNPSNGSTPSNHNPTADPPPARRPPPTPPRQNWKPDLDLSHVKGYRMSNQDYDPKPNENLTMHGINAKGEKVSMTLKRHVWEKLETNGGTL